MKATTINPPRTCMEKGSCQRRKPACDGCTWRHGFAPGVIEGPVHRKPKGWARRILLAVPLLVVVAFAVGYIGRLWGVL